MISAIVDNDEELKRLMEARQAATLAARNGSVDKTGTALAAMNQAAVDSVKPPEIGMVPASTSSSGGSVLGGLPNRIGASPGIVSPGDFDVMALFEESRSPSGAPQTASQSADAPQVAPAARQVSSEQEASVSPQAKRQGLDPQMEAAMRHDATMRFARAIERGGREIVGGLTLTKPDTGNLVTPEGTAEADLRAILRQRAQAELDKQEAARKLLKEQNESDRIGMWGKQIDASITNAGARAKMAERELAQKELDAAASRDVQAGHYRDMSEAQRNANSLGWANLKQRENESKREFELRKEKAQKGDGEGHLLPISGVEDFATGEQATFLLDALPGKAKELNPTTMGALLDKLPFVSTDTGKYESDLKAATQVVGKYLEGGKLAAGDDVKYRNLMPRVKDSPEVLKYKIDGLKEIMARTAKIRSQLLQDSGYKTPRIDWAEKIVGGSGASPTTPQQGGATVKVVAPDGRSKMMSREQAEQLVKKHGFTIQE